MSADRHAPDDREIRRILGETRTVAVVGASIKPARPSHFVSRYMQRHGYRILPVNPGYVGTTILGEPVHADLGALPDPPDMVAIFRRSEHAGAVADRGCRMGARFIWMQVGIEDAAAAERARVAGRSVVMNRCLMVEHSRLRIA
jgi:predicted CoA-binding protein